MESQPNFDQMSPAEAMAYLESIQPAWSPEEVAAERAKHARLLAALEAEVPDISFVEYGGACPEQGYGWWTPTGEAVYFRFRSDVATLEVGPAQDGDTGPARRPMPDRTQVRLYAELYAVTGDPLAGGTFSTEQTTSLVRRLHGLLRPVQEWPDGTRVGRLQDYLRTLAEHLETTANEGHTTS